MRAASVMDVNFRDGRGTEGTVSLAEASAPLRLITLMGDPADLCRATPSDAAQLRHGIAHTLPSCPFIRQRRIDP